MRDIAEAEKTQKLAAPRRAREKKTCEVRVPKSCGEGATYVAEAEKTQKPTSPGEIVARRREREERACEVGVSKSCGEGAPYKPQRPRQGAEETHVGPEPGTTSIKQQKIHMASSKASNRKNMEAKNGILAPLALSRIFGEEEDIMEIDSPA